MTDIEKKALALVNEVLAENGMNNTPHSRLPTAVSSLVLLRAIEQHDAFRREVSDAVVAFRNEWLQATPSRQWFQAKFTHFIIAKPDPLVEVWDHMIVTGNFGPLAFRAAIEARGGRIVWEGEP